MAMSSINPGRDKALSSFVPLLYHVLIVRVGVNRSKATPRLRSCMTSHLYPPGPSLSPHFFGIWLRGYHPAPLEAFSAASS